MSLITDLLAKVRHQEPKRDIPPLLRDTVIRIASERRSANRLRISLFIALSISLAGAAAVFLTDFLHKPSNAQRTSTNRTSVTAPKAPPIAPSWQPVKADVAALSSTGDSRTMTGAGKNLTAKNAAASSIRRKAASEKPSPATPATRPVEYREGAEKMREPAADKQPPAKGQDAMSVQEREILFYSARSNEMQKNYQGALSDYRKALSLDPGNHIAMNNIAGVLVRTGAYEEAVGYAQNSLKVRRDYIPAYINLGIAYSQLGKYEEGETSFRQALSADPANHSALLNYGVMQEKRDALDKAYEIYVGLSDLGNVQGYLGLARIAEKQGKTSEAIRLYQEVLSMESRDTSFWNAAADRLRQLSK